MLDHHLQKAIIYQLAFTPHARFSELQPDGVENKLFTYHLKKVITAGYVAKLEDGSYELTPQGRRLGLEALKSDQALLDKAYSILQLVVRRKSDGAWLLYTRQRQPLFGYISFPQANPTADTDVLTVASQTLTAKTGLEATFTALGSGYIHTFRGDELESFISFTLLQCGDVHGDLEPNDERGTYEWVQNPDFSDPAMLPSMATLVELYEKNEPFFVDKTFTI